MLKVILKKGENVNQAVKRLKKKVRNTGLIKEIRKRQEFVKPSVLKRKAKKQAIFQREWEAKNNPQ